MMLRILVLAALLAASSTGSATEMPVPATTFPALPRSAMDAAGFTPTGWALEAQAAGDLNRDDKDDLVMVFREQNPRNILADESSAMPALNTNPRILAVALSGGAGTPYRLVLENHTLIPRHETSTLEDAFDKEDGPTVRRGAFTVTLGMFANAGGWDMARISFTFRYEDGHFGLIGYDRSTVTRSTGAMEDISVNFANNRVRIETGTIQEDVGKVRWSTVPKDTRPTIESVGDGLEFEPTGMKR